MNRYRKKGENSWLNLILFVALTSLLMKVFVFSPFNVKGASMQPTLQNQDHLLMNKAILYFFPVKRGDIIIIKKPDESRYYVKRVIGLAGDTIKMIDGTLYVNGEKQQEPYLDSNLLKTHKQSLWLREVAVPQGKVFVMGDNRLNSLDSRNGLGYIDSSYIVGIAEGIYFPFNRIKHL